MSLWRAFQSSPCSSNVVKAVSAKAENDHVLNQTLSGFLPANKRAGIGYFQFMMNNFYILGES
jgi:hypothetical protein